MTGSVTLGTRSFDETEIRKIVSESEAGAEIEELCAKHGIEKETLQRWKGQYGLRPGSDFETQKLVDENRNLKQIVAELLLEKRTLLQHRISFEEARGAGAYCGLSIPEQDAAAAPHPELGPLGVDQKPGAEHGEPGPQAAHMDPVAGSMCEIHRSVGRLLERSRIIPAIRNSEYIPAAIASPGLIVWLLFGSPMTIGDVVRKMRAAGKLPIANLDLLTGFAQDADAVSLLVKLGVAGIVSTRQSALRAAHSQGIMAIQRTFAVDSIALHNITRALHHFVPHAIELLPAVAAPLAVPSFRAVKPELPVIATGLVNSLRQVEELVGHGITSVATSNSSLWII
jgi:glycerol uptake operon antiterminator